MSANKDEGPINEIYLYLLNDDRVWQLLSECRDQNEFATALKELFEGDIELPLEDVDPAYSCLLRWALTQIDYELLSDSLSHEIGLYRKGLRKVRTRGDAN